MKNEIDWKEEAQKQAAAAGEIKIAIAQKLEEVRGNIVEIRHLLLTEDTALDQAILSWKAEQLERWARFLEDLLYTGGAEQKQVGEDWIPVGKEMPPFVDRLQATILHHEWIADYDSSWVPDEEKRHHKEYTEVCEIIQIDGKWFFANKEDGYEISAAYIEPKKDLSNPMCEIIAWRLPPDPYRPTEE